MPENDVPVPPRGPGGPPPPPVLPRRRRWAWAVGVGLVLVGPVVARAALDGSDDGGAEPGGDAACVAEPTVDVVEFTDELVPPTFDLHDVRVTATVTNVAEVPIQVASVTMSMVGDPAAVVSSAFDPKDVAPGESFEFQTYGSTVQLAPGLTATPDETTAEVYWQPADIADPVCGR